MRDVLSCTMESCEFERGGKSSSLSTSTRWHVVRPEEDICVFVYVPPPKKNLFKLLCARVCGCVYVGVCVYTCVCVYVYVCVYMRVCVCHTVTQCRSETCVQFHSCLTACGVCIPCMLCGMAAILKNACIPFTPYSLRRLHSMHALWHGSDLEECVLPIYALRPASAFDMRTISELYGEGGIGVRSKPWGPEGACCA
mmetsp:Transcript_20676/g.53874  ORF Transcript_20676/g.53874 Transcript_20676/m.53874 type:complete len:197 (-) Transcript_20676:2633-3223(-)